MQQRRLRLGDILDDYCPRERRITNHVVVAMIEEEVKQTRCATCDADHEYKQARVPVRRRKEGGALVGDAAPAGPRPRAAAATPADVLDDMHPDDVNHDDFDADDDVTVDEEIVADSAKSAAIVAPAPAAVMQAAAVEADEPVEEPRIEEDGPVHRRLIRATLPRPEGQAPEWKDPDFTIRQPSHGRGGFDGNRNSPRPGSPGGPGGPGGPRTGRRPPRPQQGNAPGQPVRFGGPRPHGSNPRHGQGQGQGQGPGGNRGGGRPGPQGHGQGQGPGPGQNRGPRPGGGGGRKRGR